MFFVGGYHHGYAAAAPVVGGYGGYGVSKVVTPYAAAAPAVYGGYAAHGKFSVHWHHDSWRIRFDSKGDDDRNSRKNVSNSLQCDIYKITLHTHPYFFSISTPLALFSLEHTYRHWIVSFYLIFFHAAGYGKVVAPVSSVVSHGYAAPAYAGTLVYFFLEKLIRWKSGQKNCFSYLYLCHNNSCIFDFSFFPCRIWCIKSRHTKCLWWVWLWTWISSWIWA